MNNSVKCKYISDLGRHLGDIMEVVVSPVVYKSISSLDVASILNCSDEQLRPILACLVR